MFYWNEKKKIKKKKFLAWAWWIDQMESPHVSQKGIPSLFINDEQ